MKARRWLWTLLAPGVCMASGGPFAVDDAEIVERCQLETGWLQRDSDIRRFYFAPGCNVAGIELTLGLSRLEENADSADGIDLQAKSVLREVDDAPGLALAVGVEGSRSPWRPEVWFGSLALSHDLGEVLRVNANLGSARDRRALASSTTWGLGLDWQLAERAHLIGEVFGNDRSHRQGSQLGLRWLIRPERLHLDAVLSDALDGQRGRWLGLGLVAAWP
jgi:hypothetical protein